LESYYLFQQSSPQTTDEIKKRMIKNFARVSPCCICGGIPSLKVVYADGASRVERYCSSCANRVFSREQKKQACPLEVVYADGASRVERYCSSYANRLFSREQKHALSTITALIKQEYRPISFKKILIFLIQDIINGFRHT